jgi:hypothetical protein
MTHSNYGVLYQSSPKYFACLTPRCGLCKGKGGVQCIYDGCYVGVHPSCCRLASHDAVRTFVEAGSIDPYCLPK